jgi:hypothetical protein
MPTKQKPRARVEMILKILFPDDDVRRDASRLSLIQTVMIEQAINRLTDAVMGLATGDPAEAIDRLAKAVGKSAPRRDDDSDN